MRQLVLVTGRKVTGLADVAGQAEQAVITPASEPQSHLGYRGEQAEMPEPVELREMPRDKRQPERTGFWKVQTGKRQKELKVTGSGGRLPGVGRISGKRFLADVRAFAPSKPTPPGQAYEVGLRDAQIRAWRADKAGNRSMVKMIKGCKGGQQGTLSVLRSK